ncbi:hypothetical protein SCOCK_20069 [Actinacidiphila cocklensis]|uniref:Uncharacterized protein n=1 Tax=Actinacidiphila cocklensis TaxID=887465 RepID=A0A9W4DS83_9ACTN|nr:hypothetical protein SCOCK_20069 [Actinacidiphila cocklensis]
MATRGPVVGWSRSSPRPWGGGGLSATRRCVVAGRAVPPPELRLGVPPAPLKRLARPGAQSTVLEGLARPGGQAPRPRVGVPDAGGVGARPGGETRT